MLRHNQCFLIFNISWKSDEGANFSFSAFLAQSFCHVLNKNKVIERKHVNESNQLRLRQNLAFSFVMYFYVRPSQSVRHIYF